MRQAQYTTDRFYRIISLPSNLWQLQCNLNGARGSRTNDPWSKRSHSITLGEAQALLRSHQPAKAKVSFRKAELAAYRAGGK